MAELSRRKFLSTMTKGTASMAILGVAACSDATEPSATTGGPETTAANAAPTTSVDGVTTSKPEVITDPAMPEGAVNWGRVNLGFVSAYVLERAGEVAIVDTGVAGSAGEIERALGELGLGWGNVGHVIATHSHGDHVGSLHDVMTAAPDATGYIGEADAASVTAPRELTIVNDGDNVFDLFIVGTPGHTAGHISVWDPLSAVLVAGDAINGGSEPESITGANAQFTSDIPQADRSIAKMALLAPDTILFGHGEPVTVDAAIKIAELAASL